MERLQKVMAHAGIASRRKSEEIISQGRVKVNGKTVTKLGTKVDPENDLIEVDGNQIFREKRVYLLLNKPIGYVTTVDDPRGRKTVLDLIEDIPQRIYPVGRLDYDTSGLLLLTNDGEMTYVLTHPSHKIDKTYLVEVSDHIKNEELQKLERGVKLKDGLTAPARTKLIYNSKNRSIFTITIHEGKNRQVRRMCDFIGFKIDNLKRISFGPLTLDDLPTGNFRYLTSEEINKLKKLK